VSDRAKPRSGQAFFLGVKRAVFAERVQASAFAAILTRAATTLQVHARDIAVRWGEQSRTVVLRDPTALGKIRYYIKRVMPELLRSI